MIRLEIRCGKEPDIMFGVVFGIQLGDKLPVKSMDKLILESEGKLHF